MALTNIDTQKIANLSLKLTLGIDWKKNAEKISTLLTEHFPFIDLAAFWSYPGDFVYLSNNAESIFKTYFYNIKRADMIQSKELVSVSIPSINNCFSISINLDDVYLGMLIIHTKHSVDIEHLKALVKVFLSQLSLAKYATMMANEVEKRTSTDKITGLWNRTYFNERFREEVERVMKSKEIGAVILISLDELAGMEKVINKEEKEGLLLKASNIIRKTVRKTDWVVLWDKYEILLYLNNTQLESTIDVVSRFAKQLSNSHPLLVPMIGVSNTTEANAARALIQLSNKRMELSRKDGRKAIVCYAIKEGIKFLQIA